MENETFACCCSQHDVTVLLNLQNAKKQSHGLLVSLQPVRQPDHTWGETDDQRVDLRLVSFISLFLNAPRDNSVDNNLTVEKQLMQTSG